MSKGTVVEQAEASMQVYWSIIGYLMVSGVPEEKAAIVAENHGTKIDRFIDMYMEGHDE